MTELVTPEPTTTVVDDPTKPYKAIAAVTIPIIITIIQLVQIQLGDDVWSRDDTINVILAALGAVVVYLVPNPKAVAKAHY
jgi:hypothetical protein